LSVLQHAAVNIECYGVQETLSASGPTIANSATSIAVFAVSRSTDDQRAQSLLKLFKALDSPISLGMKCLRSRFGMTGSIPATA
jgi:hypothetical protein